MAWRRGEKQPACATRRGRAFAGVISIASIAFGALLTQASCTRGPASAPSSAGSDGAVGEVAATLTVWAHAGRQSEREVLRDLVRRLDEDDEHTSVDLTFLPEGSYNSQVQAAALAGELPDVLELDGPFVASYVWQGHLRPLDDLLPTGTRERLLPSIVEQGTVRGALYAVGMFDSGLGIYGRRSLLRAAGVRCPEGAEDAWSAQEFDDALRALAADDADGAVLDLKLNYSGEWFTYAFSPLLVSAGGDLVRRGERPAARGVLDCAASLAALQRVQSWITAKRVDPNLDDDAFTGGRVALSWVGHWEYPRYAKAWGEDLVVLPLPDFGAGSRTGMGSWCWGVTSGSAHTRQAAQLLTHLLGDGAVLAMSDANGAVPAVRSALGRSALYAPGAPLRLFADQLVDGAATPRPRTPAYPVITSQFQQVFDDLRHGLDLAASLARAATAIDREIADNQGYPQR